MTLIACCENHAPTELLSYYIAIKKNEEHSQNKIVLLLCR